MQPQIINFFKIKFAQSHKMETTQIYLFIFSLIVYDIIYNDYEK